MSNDPYHDHKYSGEELLIHPVTGKDTRDSFCIVCGMGKASGIKKVAWLNRGTQRGYVLNGSAPIDSEATQAPKMTRQITSMSDRAAS